MKRAAIIYNPQARNAPKLERLLASKSPFRQLGWDIDVRPTEQAGHGVELARQEAQSGADVVFACGGDGTVNEVVNGLARSETSFAVIRGGMGDVFAKEIGVPRNPEAALEVLLSGDDHLVDLGCAADRYFLAMCGVGFDASIVRAVPSTPKRRLGSTSYVFWGLKELLSYRSRPVRLEVDADTLDDVQLYWLLMGNTRSYGGAINITEDAVLDDGRLDTFVFSGSGPAWLAQTAARIALRRFSDAAGVRFHRAARLTVSSPGLPVQADGEYLGVTPMSFSVLPAALHVLMPAGRGRELFSPSGTVSPD